MTWVSVTRADMSLVYDKKVMLLRLEHVTGGIRECVVAIRISLKHSLSEVARNQRPFPAIKLNFSPPLFCKCIVFLLFRITRNEPR